MGFLRKAVITALLGIFFSNAACAIGAEPDCGKIAKLNANQLLALWEIGFAAEYSPETKCSSGAPALDPSVCDRKLTILQDRNFACGRRLLLIRTSGLNLESHESVYVFGTVDGQVKQLLEPKSTSLGSRHEIKVEQATGDRLVLVDPKDPAARNVVVWDTKLQRYKSEGSVENKPIRLGCVEIGQVKSNDLIILASGYDHGIGCYSEDEDEPQNCDFKVELDEDRMISPTRRLISFEADHQTGSGAWGSTNIFDCAAGQVRTIFGDTALYGASLIKPPEKPASPEASSSATQPASADELVLLEGHWTDRDAHCCPSLEELVTYQWSESLQNYMLTGVHYRATKR